MYLMGPTGGYLIGFIISAFIAGLLFSKKISFNRSFLSNIIKMRILFQYL